MRWRPASLVSDSTSSALCGNTEAKGSSAPGSLGVCRAKRAPKVSSMVLRATSGMSFMSCLSTDFERESIMREKGSPPAPWPPRLGGPLDASLHALPSSTPVGTLLRVPLCITDCVRLKLLRHEQD